jgi:hypothetical protein
MGVDMIRIAHRGSCVKYQENSLSGFEYAVASGIEWIEIDIQNTRDNQFVLLHENPLKTLLPSCRRIDSCRPKVTAELTLLNDILRIHGDHTIFFDIKFKCDESSLREFLGICYENRFCKDYIFGISLPGYGKTIKQIQPDAQTALTRSIPSCIALLSPKKINCCDYILFSRLFCYKFLFRLARRLGKMPIVTTPHTRAVDYSVLAKRMNAFGYYVNI